MEQCVAARLAARPLRPPASLPLPARLPVPAPLTLQVLISELMTDNKATIKDEDGASPDWIELHNVGGSAVSLAVSWAALCTRGRLAVPEAFSGYPWERVLADCSSGVSPIAQGWTEHLARRSQACWLLPNPQAATSPSSPFLHLQGYRLVDSPTPGPADSWTFPPGVSLAPGQYLLVFASGKNRTNPSSPLHTSFKLSPQDGYLALLDPSGGVASRVQFPE